MLCIERRGWSFRAFRTTSKLKIPTFTAIHVHYWAIETNENFLNYSFQFWRFLSTPCVQISFNDLCISWEMVRSWHFRHAADEKYNCNVRLGCRSVWKWPLSRLVGFMGYAFPPRLSHESKQSSLSMKSESFDQVLEFLIFDIIQETTRALEGVDGEGSVRANLCWYLQLAWRSFCPDSRQWGYEVLC